MKPGGGRLSEGEEDVAHNSGAEDPRGGDDVEDSVHVLTQVLLRGAEDGGHRRQTLAEAAHVMWSLWTRVLTLFVSRFSDSFSLTGSISHGLCSVQI